MDKAIRLAGTSARPLPRRLTLTLKLIAEIPAPARGRTVIHDTGTSLCVEVTPAGSRTFYVYRRFQGRPRRIRIGPVTDYSMDQARKQAGLLVGQLLSNVDPRRPDAATLTLGALWDRYLADHAKVHKRSWEQDEALWTRRLARYKRRQLSDLTVGAVTTLHSRIGAGAPTEANRTLALLSSMFGYARRTLAYPGPNPCGDVRRFREVSRERFLLPDEMTAFLKAVDAEPDPLLHDFFWLLLLTGARRSNVQGMRWDQIDEASHIWTIPAASAKAGRPIRVHLSQEATDALQRRRKLVGREIGWVFPSWGSSGHLREPKGAWKRLLTRAGLTDLRMHDLRRTLGSWQAAVGTSSAIIGKSLGHSSTQATAIYTRLNIDPVRKSVDAATAEIMRHHKPPENSPKSI